MSGQEDYKATLNLPRTDFPMKAGLAQREPELLQRWERERLTERILEARKGAPRFILHDGPPYANGHIHYGHILNKSLKDIIIKSRSMAGFAAPYVPGWDCHGLPIELQVERDLGARRKDMDAPAVRRACHEHAMKMVDIQRSEFKRLGVFGDWEHPYLTLAPQYEATIVRALATFVRQGAIYRDKKPVYWCTTDQTALAEAEIEYKDHTSPSIYVAFPLVDFDASRLDGRLAGADLKLVIWTTTPWTLPANLAVVLGPRFQYTTVPGRTPGERFLVARALAPAFLAACNLPVDEATFIDIPADRLPLLEAARYRHPFLEPPLDAAFRVWFADHVTLEQGTGLVHTAPGHGPDDYQVGRAHGLPIYSPLDEAGRFVADVPHFGGLPTREANPRIVAFLADKGALLSDPKATVRHSYPHCWRCKNPVLFAATPQWFLALDHHALRQRALDEIDKTTFIPPWGRNRIYGMVENRPDWVLSRQRVWGTPIPFFHCAACKEPHVEAAALEHVADLFEVHGADVWFTRPAEELTPPGLACRACGGTRFTKDDSIVDVWFESGTSFQAVCAVRPELGLPADLYLEGSDQHRGWFHSSLLVAMGVLGHAPYRAVLTHGFVLDEHGQPYSKSEIERRRKEGKKVDYIPPDEIIASQGAELLRAWVASTEFRSDIPYSRTIVNQLGESYRKLRNTFRFILGNLYDFTPADAVPDAALAPFDRYALHRLGEVVRRLRKAYEDVELHVVFRGLIDYVTVEVSALLLDVLKDRLYCDAPDAPSRRSAQTVVHAVGVALATLSAPVFCFTAEEVWGALPRADGAPDSVHIATFPDGAAPRVDEAAWAVLLATRERALKALEPFRAAKHHPLDARVTVRPGPGERAPLEEAAKAGFLAELLGVSQVELVAGGDGAAAEVTVDQAPGHRCERCWKFTPDAPLCARCQAVVSRLSQEPS